eukprot:Opistho-2@15310
MGKPSAGGASAGRKPTAAASNQPMISRFFAAPAKKAGVDASKSNTECHRTGIALLSPQKSPVSGTKSTPASQLASPTRALASPAVVSASVLALPPTPAESEGRSQRASAANNRKRTTRALLDASSSDEAQDKQSPTRKVARLEQSDGGEGHDASVAHPPVATSRPKRIRRVIEDEDQGADDGESIGAGGGRHAKRRSVSAGNGADGKTADDSGATKAAAAVVGKLASGRQRGQSRAASGASGASGGGDGCESDDNEGSEGLARLMQISQSASLSQDARHRSSGKRPASANGAPASPKGKEPPASVESFAYVAGGPASCDTVVGEDRADARRRQQIHKRLLGVEIGGVKGQTDDDAAVGAAGAVVGPQSPGGAGALPTGSKLAALTPLEQQFVAVKRKYADAVLFVECGYKFRFFGQDAQIASKELNIMAFWNHNFLTASIPTHRLPVHVKRLVNLGYKVGVVRQTETAALKAAGDTKSKPFTRELKALYTKATLVGEDIDSLDDAETQGGLPQSTYLMCLSEDRTKGPDNVRIAFVAVRPATGDIVYDEFDDEVSRSELETRLVHLQPSEMLLPASLSPRTERLVANMAVKWGNDDGMRLERLPNDQFDHTGAFSRITEFYSSGNAATAHPLESITSLPSGVVACLSALIGHLREFGLESALKLTSNVVPFSSRNVMTIGGTAATNLELFKNATDGSERGSLYAVVNHAVTPFGRRLLRRWVSAPLMDKRDIEERLDAVECLAGCEAKFVADIRGMMSHLSDLDRGLCRIYYCKCSPQEFLSIVRSFERVSDAFGTAAALAEDAFASSSLLRALCKEIPRQAALVAPFLRDIDADAARSGRKPDMFRRDEELYPSIPRTKTEIARVMKSISSHLADVRRTLKNSTLEYVTVSNVEFLVEVKVAHLSAVPANWMKMSATKAVARFHTPHIIAATKELQQLRERLEIEASAAWMTFLGQFSVHYDELRAAVRGLATYDCLLSLAAVARMPGYVRPSIVGEDEGCARVSVVAGRHPMVDAMATRGQFVPNDVNLAGDGERCMIITGPNMGGKSCYMRQVALLAILAQMGSFVPADAATVGIVDAVYTRMGASDNINKGASTFMIELQEAAEIVKSATPRSLVILDELGRGTSTHDGVAIAYATLHHVIAERKCLTLFVTHYPSLSGLEALFPRIVGNYHMAFMDDSPGTAEESITFLYQLTRGVAARSFGLNVARLANVPIEIIERASAKSHEMEKTVRSRGGIDGLHIYLLHEFSTLLHRRTSRDGDAVAVDGNTEEDLGMRIERVVSQIRAIARCASAVV